MTQNEIIEIASQVYGESIWHESALLRLESFVKLVAAKAIAELESQERNFCPRCGKRTADLTVIHTCTPPQNIEQDLSEQGRKKSAILGNNIEEMVNNGLPFLTALDTALKVYDHHTPRLHQPQRTWVGLTDEEIDSYFEDHGWSPSEDYYPVIKAIEAKLKEKNT
jgi:hypothetical protein